MKPILFLDSGVGGLPYLIHFWQKYPWIKTYYFADNANFPYGLKNENQLKTILVNNIQKFALPLDPSIVVLACNTASVVGLDYLREKFTKLLFVGTVPAIKPAAEKSKTRKLGLLATSRTVQDPYLDELQNTFAQDCMLVKCAVDPLVSWIEQGNTEYSPELEKIVFEAREQFLVSGVDSIVLGCTHFLHAEQSLRQIFGSQIELIDSRIGITKRIEYLLSLNVCSCLQNQTSGVEIPRLIFSKKQNPGRIYEKYIEAKLLQFLENNA